MKNAVISAVLILIVCCGFGDAMFPASLKRWNFFRRNCKMYATCFMQPNQATPPAQRQPITGRVDITQTFSRMKAELKININISGVSPAGLHGFHVHTLGDLSNGCQSATGHFNPFNQVHGGLTDPISRRHVGDWGNVRADGNGNIQMTLYDKIATLYGKRSILGRTLMLHALEDDLGRGGDEESKKTGNAGARLACCVIGRAEKPSS